MLTLSNRYKGVWRCFHMERLKVACCMRVLVSRKKECRLRSMSLGRMCFMTSKLDWQITILTHSFPWLPCHSLHRVGDRKRWWRWWRYQRVLRRLVDAPHICAAVLIRCAYVHSVGRVSPESWYTSEEAESLPMSRWYPEVHSLAAPEPRVDITHAVSHAP
jgi:hypothetical protein